jgi:polysaccharide biosynthesis transport protein
MGLPPERLDRTMTPQARSQAIAESDAGRRTAVDFLRVLAERKLLIISVVVACIAASLAISLTSSKEYTAESELLLRDPGFARTLFGSNLFEGGVDPERVTSTKVAVIESPAVSQRVQTAVSERFPGADVEGTVDVTPNENSDVVTIEATSDTPAKAAAIANAYAAEYIAYQRELDRKKIQDAQQLVQENLDTLPVDSTSEREGLEDSLKQLKVLEALQTGNADVVARATPPDSPSAPKPVRNAVLAGFLGLLLGIGAALLADFLDRRLKTADAFERVLGSSVLVTIPRGAVPQASDGELVGRKAEPYRMLREGLRFLEIGGPHRCLLVTSGDPGEGKTTVAVNLARALVAGGERVILIDADLRRPAAGRQLGLPEAPLGLSLGLVNEQPVAELLVDVPPDGRLRLLPTGPTPPNPADLLRTRRMREIIDETREMADVVIVDAPPLLPVSDTHALLDLPNVTGVVMVARFFSTRRDRAAEARRLLERSDRPVLGLVLTGARETGGDDSYYGSIVTDGQPGQKERRDGEAPHAPSAGARGGPR